MCCVFGLFSAFTVKVTSSEKVAVINFEWMSKPGLRESSMTSKSSSMIAALLDPGTSEPSSSERIVRSKFRVGNRVLAYLQSHSTILAMLCCLVSCRKNRQTPTNHSGPEKPINFYSGFHNRIATKIVQYNGCSFVREFDVAHGDGSSAEVDENLRDYIFRRLKHQLPTLKRFFIQFLSPLMPGAEDSNSDPFWLLCSREIPDDLCSLLPSLFTDRYFICHVYRHISQLLQVHSLQSVGLDKFSGEPTSRNVENILRLSEVVPSSVVRNSVTWATLQDFIIISAVKLGSLSPAYTLQVHDPDTRCRLLMSTLTQVDATERSSFVNMLKSCLTDVEGFELKRVVEKRIVTEKLLSEVILYECDLIFRAA